MQQEIKEGLSRAKQDVKKAAKDAQREVENGVDQITGRRKKLDLQNLFANVKNRLQAMQPAVALGLIAISVLVAVFISQHILGNSFMRSSFVTFLIFGLTFGLIIVSITHPSEMMSEVGELQAKLAKELIK